MSQRDAVDASTLIHARSEETPTFRSAELVIVAGPDAGLRFVVDGAKGVRVLLGTGPACDLRLSDRHVSRRHFALDPAERGLRLSDLGSANGTWVNGVRVTGCELAGGEVIGLGGTRIEVRPFGAPTSPALGNALRFGRMLGKSPAMRALYPLCERLAATDVPVVIEGETGTGKEVLAEALHEEGPRANGPFIVFDCTAVPPTLVESVLFGHEKGSFTGATASRRGVFEDAHGGTLLIDEIGELDVSLQPKLLRALERSEVQRVGSNQWIRVDVRIMAATRRDLDHEVQAGRFRDDLFFRLAVGRIELPALRDRHGDIALLARHFWRTLGGSEAPISEAFLARLEDYAFPGNVRELHNTVLRALALGTEEAGLAPSPRRSTAPPPLVAGEPGSADPIEHVLGRDLPLARARAELVEEFERRYVARALMKHGGNVVRAAAASGIARRYFQILKAKLAK